MRKLLLLWVLILAVSNKSFAADVALVTSVKGDVKVHQPAKDNWRKVSAMQGLPSGSKLQVGAGGGATVVFMGSGARFSLAGGSVVVVSAQGCNAIAGPAPKALGGLAVRHQRILQQSLVASGRPASTVLRGGEKAITLLSLKDTSLPNNHPVFKWQPVVDATSYQVRVLDDNDKAIWQTQVTPPTVAYPVDAPELKSGTDYHWEVTTKVHDTDYTGEGLFRVLPPEKQQAVKDELAALQKLEDKEVAALLKAEVYHQHDLMDDAISSYKALATKYPNSASVHSALAKLLAEQDRGAESKAQQAQVDALDK